MNWEYKQALNEYKPTIDEHLALKQLKPTLNALIQYADDIRIVDVSVRTIAKDLNKTPNTISEHIRKLIHLGFIKLLDKKGKFGKQNTKLLCLPNVSVNVSVDVSVNVSDNVSVNVSPITDTEESMQIKKVPTIPPKGVMKPFYNEAMEVAKYLSEAILEYQPTARKTKNLKGWAEDIVLAINEDKRSPEQLMGCIDWIYREFGRQQDFWKSNIRSGKKLREYFDRVESQAMGGR